MRRFWAREIVINYHQNLEMDLKMINKILDSNGRDSWRFDPNTLFVVLRRANDFNNKKVGE